LAWAVPATGVHVGRSPACSSPSRALRLAQKQAVEVRNALDDQEIGRTADEKIADAD
jgi:hypothetical protein